MNPHEEAASLASYLRALGYDATDVAGCVRVRHSRWCSLTVECEADRFRFIPRSGQWPLQLAFGVYWFAIALAIGIGLFSLFRGDSAETAVLWPALVVTIGMPSLLLQMVRDLETDAASNTLRVLIATKASTARRD